MIELTINEPPENVDIGQITQKMEGVDRLDLQAPWDEKYLDESGEEVIGEFCELPKGKSSTRLAFFFHYLDLAKPLETPYGPLSLIKPTKMPRRLEEIIRYEQPD